MEYAIIVEVSVGGGVGEVEVVRPETIGMTVNEVRVCDGALSIRKVNIVRKRRKETTGSKVIRHRELQLRDDDHPRIERRNDGTGTEAQAQNSRPTFAHCVHIRRTGGKPGNNGGKKHQSGIVAYFENLEFSLETEMDRSSCNITKEIHFNAQEGSKRKDENKGSEGSKSADLREFARLVPKRSSKKLFNSLLCFW